MLLWTLGCMHLFKLVFASPVLLLFLGSFPPALLYHCPHFSFVVSADGWAASVALTLPSLVLPHPPAVWGSLPCYQESKTMTVKVGAGECVSGWNSTKKKGLFCMWRGGWRDPLMIEKWVWFSQSNASNFTAMNSLYPQWHSQAVVLSSSQGRINCFSIFDAFAFVYSCAGALPFWKRIACLGSASSLTQLSKYTFTHNTHTHTHTHTIFFEAFVHLYFSLQGAWNIIRHQ